MKPGEIKLGGRIFSLVNYAAITSLNEHYVMKFMRETALDRVLPDDGLPDQGEITALLKSGQMTDEEADRLREEKKLADAKYFSRLHEAVVDSLRLHELLAGYLVPADKTEADFTLEQAAEVTRFLQRLNAADDRAEIHRLGAVVVLDFFQAGVDSLNDFPRSFGRDPTSPTPTSPQTTSQTAAA